MMLVLKIHADNVIIELRMFIKHKFNGMISNLWLLALVGVSVKTVSTIGTETCRSYGRHEGHNNGEYSPARAVKRTTPKCCTSRLSFASLETFSLPWL